MLAKTSLVLAGLIALVNAHFQLQYPPPRGVFVMNSEPNFCDGYDNAVSNRTVFPLNDGFFSLNSEHTQWTAGVTLSTKANPTQFSDFATIIPFFDQSGEGLFCFTLDLLKTNATGLTDGQNVTLEIVFNGGDGQLYQCADLTLSSTATISSSVSCANGTHTSSFAPPSSATSLSPSGSATSFSPSGSATPTSPGGSSPTSSGTDSSSAASQSSPSAAGRIEQGSLLSIVLGLLGIAAVVF